VERREFLAGALATAAAMMAARAAGEAAGEGSARPTGEMIRRPLGTTGVTVSAIGLGGFHIGRYPDEAESVRIIRTAVERGITFLDNSWDYNDGASERRMGAALRDGYREKVCLMTKIDGRTRAAAAAQIDESLRRLGTDRVDLMQIHEVIRMEDPDRVFGDYGAIRALTDAKKAGKIRFIGFTGHKDPAVHLRMLDVAHEHGFRFDTVQMPLNVMDAHFRSFERLVLPRLVEERIGVLGMKSMGGNIILDSKTVTPTECLHYALNLPTSTVITGIDSMPILEQALAAAASFRPMTSDQVAALLAKTRTAAASGAYELFKTSDRFDSTAHNPHWLG